jgi:hypothetical protein
LDIPHLTTVQNPHADFANDERHYVTEQVMYAYSACFAVFSKVLARPMGLPKYLTRSSLGLMAYTWHIPYYLSVA